jgi:hypothetical protein
MVEEEIVTTSGLRFWQLGLKHQMNRRPDPTACQEVFSGKGEFVVLVMKNVDDAMCRQSAEELQAERLDVNVEKRVREISRLQLDKLG